MDNKKRKRDTEGNGLDDRISVAYCEPSGSLWRPILAISPGIELAKSLNFTPYTSQAQHGRLHLHSDQHPRLDCVVNETGSASIDEHLRHYIGIHDEAAGTLQIVPVQRMTVRNTLKTARRRPEAASQLQTLKNAAARVDLGLAFGTKKAQKAIRSATANAISPAKARTKRAESGSPAPQFDNETKAVLTAISATGGTLSREEMEVEINSRKPRPAINEDALAPGEVFDLLSLVGGAESLGKMKVKEWTDAFNDQGQAKPNSDGRFASSTSSFVASHMADELGKRDNMQMISALRYLELIIRWYKQGVAQHSARKGARAALPSNHKKMTEMTDIYGRPAIENIIARFTEKTMFTQWHADNLITHILALTLIFDNFVTDPAQIRNDLGLDTKKIAKYFRELGCTPRSLTKVEKDRRKAGRIDAQEQRIMELKLPLNLPKTRLPASKKK